MRLLKSKILYRDPLVTSLFISRTPHHHLRYSTAMGYLDHSIEQDTAALKKLLTNFDGLNPKSRNLPFGPVARIEIIQEGLPNMDHTRHSHGAVFFDTNGEALFHVPYACLGYSGSGADFARDLLRFVGVSRQDIDAADISVQHQNYLVVFSRQKYRLEGNGDEVVVPKQIESRWSWWRVR